MMMSELENYFKGDSLAASVWKGKYGIMDEKTPEDMHRRMAKEFARIEANYGGEKQLTEEQIFNYFDRFKYIVPQGSIMSMLGNKYAIGSLSNCFVVGQPHDSYGGIMHKDQQLVQLMKRRGGVGIDISTLRPATAAVSNAAGSSTGAVSFMHRFSNTTREVAQNGRRGALMISMDCRHPDVWDFINIKSDLTKVTGANISVMQRDDFMQAVRNDGDYYLRFPCDLEFNVDYDFEYNKLTRVETPGKDIYVRRIKAREYFYQLVKNNWLSAEPGSIYIDRHWNYSPDGVYARYKGVTTNPCGEIFMQPYDACRLMAINFFSFVNNPFTEGAYLDLRKLYEVAYVQQRLADDLVDLELEHISRIIDKINSDDEPEEVKKPELDLWNNIYKTAKAGRRTGCGFTGLGDMLAALNLKYDSDEGKKAIDKVMTTKFKAELTCTIDMAEERGTFEGWNANTEFNIRVLDGKNDELVSGTNDFYEMLRKDFPELALRMSCVGRRNVSWSTVAPTGTVSLMTQTTSGLEPLFAPYYFRNKKGNPGDKNFRIDFTDQNGDHWMTYPVMHPKFQDWVNMLINAGELEKDIDSMTKEDLDNIYKQSPWYGSCANDIDWIQRVEIQAIIQKYTTHSISSTINLPNDVKEDKIAEIYLAAWEMGLKGVTVYRDGCRTGVLVTDNTKKEEGIIYHDAPKRPEKLDADVHVVTVKGQRYTVAVGLLDGKPYEIFAFNATDTNKSGKGVIEKRGKSNYVLLSKGAIVDRLEEAALHADEQMLTRLLSGMLRHGVKPKFIYEQIDKCPLEVVSFGSAVKRVLKKYVSEKELTEGKKCSDCGSTNIRLEEGCQKCMDCGSSKCG